MSFSLNSRFIRECFLGYHTQEMAYRLAFMPDGINLNDYTDIFHRGQELTSDTMPSGGIAVDSAWIALPQTVREYPKLKVDMFRYAILYNETQANRIIGVFDLKGTAGTDIANHLPVLIGQGTALIGDDSTYYESLFVFDIPESYIEIIEDNAVIGGMTTYDCLRRNILGGYHQSTHQYKLAFFPSNIPLSVWDELYFMTEVTTGILSEAYKVTAIVGTYLSEDANKVGISGDTCITTLDLNCPYILLYNDTTLKPISFITLEAFYDNSVTKYPQGFPIFLGDMFLSANKI